MKTFFKIAMSLLVGAVFQVTLVFTLKYSGIESTVILGMSGIYTLIMYSLFED